MQWARETVPFRRQVFDDERPPLRQHVKPAILPTTPDPRPVERLIVIPAVSQPTILSFLLAQHCAVTPRGADWHIEARDREAFQTIVGFLKLHRIHGVLRRRVGPATVQGG